MHHKTLAELATGLAAKDFSSVELTRHFLERIRRHDGTLNSFITVCEEQALAQAAAADAAGFRAERAVTGGGEALRDVKKIGGAAAQGRHHHDAGAVAEGVDCNADFAVLCDE